MPPSLAEILLNDSKRLEAALNLDSSSARIEVQCLLQTVLQVNRAYLLTHPEQQLESEQQAHYTALFGRRLRGEPIAYLLGEREFYGLTFKVTPATLIPRPDTELLVELALQRIPLHGAFRVLDLGTGSGAIALSIAHARPDIEVTAVDASLEALGVARENALRLLVQHKPAHISTGSMRTDSCKVAVIANVRLLRSDWFSALAGGRVDLVVSGPPRICPG